MAVTLLEIEGMTCQHCVQTAQKALTSLPGVEKAEVQLVPPKAVINHDHTFTLETAIQILDQEGYKASRLL